jgi:hypothetical protein
MNTCSTSEFIHSRAGTELPISIKDLSFNYNIFSSVHKKLEEILK